MPLLERSLVLIPDRLVFNFSFGKFLKENFQFAAALQELPKPFQEGANKALRAIETDSYGDGDYRTESPEIQKYPRSQSSMAGKFYFEFYRHIIEFYVLSFSQSTFCTFLIITRIR